jgi:hypothetical protein
LKLDRDAVEKLSGFSRFVAASEKPKHVEYPEGYFYVERTLVLLFGLVGSSFEDGFRASRLHRRESDAAELRRRTRVPSRMSPLA